MRKPGHAVVVLDTLPFTRDIRLGVWRVLAEVEDNVLWPQTVFECALLWVLATATEEPRRLGTEVARLLLSAINHREHVGGLELVPRVLDRLLLVLCHCLLLLPLAFKVLVHVTEVALVQRCDLDILRWGVLRQHGLEVFEEVGLEHGVLGVVRLKHGAEETGHLLGLWWQCESHAWG